ncbi:uncharacterized protein BX664DRAFT_254329, partial [Halteromyces radiatus]|uniref:uncharacterized protein n=1 Tax=Halteromyces radiatus TaxID=101107 RepID=UPI0022211FC6
ICVISGTKKPGNLHTFLTPIYKELDLLSRLGIKVQTSDSLVIHYKVHLMTFLGDIPAIADTMNHSGHTSKSGCRSCVMKGSSFEGYGIYFPGRSSHYSLRTVNDFRQPQLYVTFLNTFEGPSFFGLEEMHLLGHGLTKQLKDLFGSPNVNEMIPDRNVAGGAWKTFPFFLDGIKLVNVGEAMLSSRCNIPSEVFGGNWDDIFARKGRAVDWMDFLLFVVPTLILPHMLDKKAQEVMHDMLLACHLCLRWEIRPYDLSFIRRSMDRFQNCLNIAMTKKAIKRKVFTITMHYLGHIWYIVQHLGPMNVYSCRSMERTRKDRR